MANLTALAAARHAILICLGWDVESQGLSGAPPVTVIVGAEAHSTLLKAIGLLGLGHDRVLRIPADDQGRMRADALPRISGPAIVCLQAGNVNSGAFDPAEEICAQAASPPGPGFTLTAPSACGLPQLPSGRTLPPGSPRPTRGPLMPTNGSTSPMTAAWPSFVTVKPSEPLCRRRWRPFLKGTAGSLGSIPRKRRAVLGESKSGQHSFPLVVQE